MTWLQKRLSELLVAPHISFHGPAGIRMGPGPIDVFSTKFNKLFTPDVKAMVAGEQMSREGLKERLLAMQRHHSTDINLQMSETDAVGSSDIPEEGPSEARARFTCILKNKLEYEIEVTAATAETGGRRQISSIQIEGNPELFVNAA
ncbi:hypothetical protein K439DRAFT_1412317 [Ramaria rubella]|nr:hypothetical protein K439DRAFT_1412317 [Ramaria rubella]